MTLPPSRQLTPRLFLELLYGVIVFEYKHVVKCGNPVSHRSLVGAFASVAKISRRHSALFAFPCHDLIQEYGLDTTENTVWPNILADFELLLFPRIGNPMTGEDIYLGYKITETGIVIPIWGSPHIYQFLKRYHTYVPAEWKDDFAVIVYELRKDLGIRGSGGKKTTPTHGSLAGLLKFSRQYSRANPMNQSPLVAMQPAVVPASIAAENYAAEEPLLEVGQSTVVQASATVDNYAGEGTLLEVEQPTSPQTSLTIRNIATERNPILILTPTVTERTTESKECSVADQLDALWTPYSAREANPRYNPESFSEGVPKLRRTEQEQAQKREERRARRQEAKQIKAQRNDLKNREWIQEWQREKRKKSRDHAVKQEEARKTQEMAQKGQEMYMKWVATSQEAVSTRLFIAFYYELVIFELTATYGAGVEVSDERIANTFAIAAEVLEKNADIMITAAAQIREQGLDDRVQVREFFKTYQPQLLNASAAQASLLNADIVSGYKISPTGIILPTWSAADERAFLEQYDVKVPHIYKDDLSVLVWEFQNHLNFLGSGGEAALVHGRLQGVTKFKDLDAETRDVFAQHDQERRHRMERLRTERLEQNRPEQLVHQLEQKLELVPKEQEQDSFCPKKERSDRYIQELLRIDNSQEVLESTLGEQEQGRTIEPAQCAAPIFDELVQYKMSMLLRTTRTTEYRRQQILELKDRLTTGLASYFQQDRLEVLLIGSYQTGLSDNSSDADFSLVNSDGSAVNLSVGQLREALRDLGYVNVMAIGSARIPVFTFGDLEANVSCDMTLDQYQGALNSKLIDIYRRIDGRFMPLWFAIRHMARKSGILTGRQRDLTSNILILMVIAFLQTETQPILPKLQCQPDMKRTKVDDWDISFDRHPSNHAGFGVANTETCAALLKRFYRYFGYDFLYQVWEVNPRMGVIRKTRDISVAASLIERKKLACAQMCVMDPFIRNRNVASRITKKKVKEIKKAFSMACKALNNEKLDALYLAL